MAAKLAGPELMKDLFEDMQRQVDNLHVSKASGEATEQKVVEEIESLCMNCHENGTTRLLLTKIPFFREIIVMSFHCEECGFKNSEIQSAGQIQERGAKYTFKVESEDDLQRQVVKGDTCVFKIEDIDLEIPAGKGRYSNIEGLLSTVRDDLAAHQEARMEQMPEVGAQVAAVIVKLSEMILGSAFPFTVSADDCSGNSWIEPSPNDASGKYSKSQYDRTSAQNGLLGLGDEVPAPAHKHDDGKSAPETNIRPEYHASGLVGADAPAATGTNNVDSEDIVENQVYSFPATCPGCTRPCDTHMKMVNIPYFKQVVLMSTVCHDCGYRSNEVKTGGEVPEKGQRITLTVETEEDLARDILKSESAALSCPELGLSVEPGTLGGRFTTVEGLLTQFRRDLRAQAFDLSDGDAEDELQRAGDSMQSETKRSWDDFFKGLTEAIEGKRKFTVIIEDPLAASYVQSLTAPEKDPKIEIEEYERTEDEEEHLGLRDIKVEGYEEKSDDEKEGAAEEA